MDKQQKQIELPLDLFDKIQTGTRLFLGITTPLIPLLIFSLSTSMCILCM